MFEDYIRWETDHRAKAPNHQLTEAVFERAAGTWAHAAGLADASVKEVRPRRKGKVNDFGVEGEKAKYQACKDAEAAVWGKYASWAVSHREYSG